MHKNSRRAWLAVGAAMIITAFGTGPAWAGSSGHHGSGSRVVALGDSFASGEGTFVYRPGTATATNRCHRSDLAYGAVLARIARSGQLVACSGALTTDLTGPNHLFDTERPQLDALSSRTRLVTLGVGGNDLGFSTILAACIQGARTAGGQCSSNPLILGLVQSRLDALSGTVRSDAVVPISELLTMITERARHAEVLVIGYPRLLGSDLARYASDPTVPSGKSCALEPTGQAVMDSADAQWANAVTDQLNAVLAAAADQARASGERVRFVAASTFRGHGLCDVKRSWINGLVVTTTGFGPETLHPTVRGQLGYLEAIVRALGREVCGAKVSSKDLRISSRS